MKVLLLAVVLVTLGVMSSARHIHPHGVNNARTVEVADQDSYSLMTDDDDYAKIVTIHPVKPSRFVPINIASYFKSREPCEEGYARDLLGICREVWD